MTTWTRIASSVDFHGQRRLLVDLKPLDSLKNLPKQIVVFTLEKSNGNDEKSTEIFAIDSTCPHSGGPMEKGIVLDVEDLAVIECPWHHYRFTLGGNKPGTCLNHSELDIECIEARITGDGEVEIAVESGVILSQRWIGQESDIPQDSPKNVIEKKPETIQEWCVKILNTPEPTTKADLTRRIYKDWKLGIIPSGHSIGISHTPERPPRFSVVSPTKVTKRGKGGNLNSRIALLHSLCSIETWAIDLAVDIVARYSNELGPDEDDFITSFLKVADDEAKHFYLLHNRLKELGTDFGSLPIHGGLWESASSTSQDILARLAVVHMVHEARGLDVNPQTIQKFANAKDMVSKELLDEIHNDEVTHVATGTKFFILLCRRRSLDKYSTFHEVVKGHFRGPLKPPFNDEARESAGLTSEFYKPLAG